MKSSYVALFLVASFVSVSASVPNVMVFYETLCPYCVSEMTSNIKAAVDKFGEDIFISLVPYGNADMKIKANGEISIKCQHGVDECTANAWHACSQIFMTPKARVEYAICTMSKDVPDRLKTCTTPSLATALEICANSQMAAGLNKLMADITGLAGIVYDSKKRRLHGVPTIFIDGFPVRNTRKPLNELICEMAQETPRQCYDEK